MRQMTKLFSAARVPLRTIRNLSTESVERQLGEKIDQISLRMEKLELGMDHLTETIKTHDTHTSRHMSTLKWAMGGLGGLSAFFGYHINENSRNIARAEGHMVIPPLLMA